MMSSKFEFWITALFVIGLTFYSCGNLSNNSIKTVPSEKQGKEYWSAYICSMHCESSRSEMLGKCPANCANPHLLFVLLNNEANLIHTYWFCCHLFVVSCKENNLSNSTLGVGQFAPEWVGQSQPEYAIKEEQVIGLNSG